MCRNSEKKVFLIINSYFIGDILLTNPMIQNIKRIWPESIVVMITSPELVDVAKYQEGVDDVIVWDRNGKQHGFWEMLKFVNNFPYKNIYATIPIYSTDRPMILGRMLWTKNLLAINKHNIFSVLIKSKYKIEYTQGNVQEEQISLLTGITKSKLVNYPMKYNIPEFSTPIIEDIKTLNNDFIVLCAKSSLQKKDMCDADVSEIIQRLSNTKVILLGKGETSKNLSQLLKQKMYDNLIDLTNQTTLLESAKIISLAKSCISVDTGMLHLACAVNCPTIALFYNNDSSTFKPSSDIYNAICVLDKSPSNIVNKLIDIQGKEVVNV